jgi:hypothetical protein
MNRCSTMRFASIFALFMSSLSLSSIAAAAPRHRYYYRDRGYYPDHQGLLLRVSGGLGGVVADDNLNDVTLSGGSGLLSLDLGGSVAPDLALHGRLSINYMFEPAVSESGDDVGDLEDTSLTFSLLGLGLTYYLPSNLYLTGVLGVSRASFKFEGDEYDALTGIGFSGDLGYEWPLGGDWGLGVAGRLELMSVRGDGERLSMATLGALLSLTYF